MPGKIAIKTLTCQVLTALLWILSTGVSRAEEAARLEVHGRRLAGAGSRVSGYGGARAAADYLEARLREWGVDEVYRHPFQVPVPVDLGAALEWPETGEQLVLHGVWPNLVRAPFLPLAGIEAELVYGGRAGPRELDGVPLEGRIAVFEYDCGQRWIRAFDLGAAAVLFLAPLAPERGHRREGTDKFLSVPADLPRFYAAGEESRILRQRLADGLRRVRLKGRMRWQQVGAENLVAIIAGTDPQRAAQALVLGTYYDAISPVPALAPGAGQAGGAAAWLEVARALAAERPARTVVLLATAGHFQALAGARALVGEWLSSSAPDSASSAAVRRLRDFEMLFYLGLDLSPGSDRLALVQAGAPYRVRTIDPPVYAQILRFAEQYERRIGAQVLGGPLAPRRERRLVGQLPERLPVEGAVFSLAGHLGLTLVTAGDERALFDSPLDLPEAVDWERLAAQLRFVRGLVSALAADGEVGPQIQERADSFGRLRGQVLSWGPQSYGPEAPVAGAWVRVRSLHRSLMGVRMDLLAQSDAEGRFAFDGLEARTLYLKPVELEVYGVDGESGAVSMALDRGPQGAQLYPADADMDHLEEEVTLVAFPCRSMVLFDLFDPRYLTTLEQLRLLDAGQEADLRQYGHCLPPTLRQIEESGYYNSYGADLERAGVAFVPVGGRVKATMTAGRFALGRRLLLLNASAALPRGEGYRADEYPRLTHLARRVAGDLRALNGARLAELQERGIRSPLLASLQGTTDSLLAAADAATAAGQYGDAVHLSRRAWSVAGRVYSDVQALVLDVVNGVLFFLVLLLPFSYFGERLLLASADLRHQALGTALVFLAAFGVLSQVHPAFELSIHPLLVLLGFLILALSIGVIALGLSRLNQQLHLALSPRVALHRADTGRAGLLVRALLLGVAQMRRRPWRTGLTCATLALLSFSLLSFTSVRSTLRFNRTPLPGAAGGDGLLLRWPGWEGMEEQVLEEVERRFGPERALARGWYLEEGLLEAAGERRARVEAVLGLEAEEGALTEGLATLEAGRFFGPGERRVCLLSGEVAGELGVGAGGRVRFLGSEYRVVGLFSSAAFDALEDINGAPLTPLDPEAQQPQEERAGRGRRGVEPAFAHLGSARLLVLPYAETRLWGEKSRLASVAVAGVGQGEVDEVAAELGLNLFVAEGGRRYLVNAVGLQALSGQRGLLVPVLIAALIVFNTMLGSVYERLGEIGTLNSVGLAPGHVAGLFLAEAAVYATLSGVLGYLLGQGAARLGWLYGAFPGLTVNYSSLSAVATSAALMAVVLLSALYPARQAARICVPGIERSWRLPAPQGALLEVSMPFTLQQREAAALVAFLAEYLEAFNEQSIGAGFYAESLEQGGGRLGARLWLAPFDQGISQDLALEARTEVEDARFVRLYLRLSRRSGEQGAWVRGNRIFINDLRKQFLVWRALDPAERAPYYGGERA